MKNTYLVILLDYTVKTGVNLCPDYEMFYGRSWDGYRKKGKP
jgi:hypothetical protein